MPAGLVSFYFISNQRLLFLQVDLVLRLRVSSVCSLSRAGDLWPVVGPVLGSQDTVAKPVWLQAARGPTIQRACFPETPKISGLQRLRHRENASFSGLFAQGLKGISGLWRRGNLAFEQILVHRFSVNIGMQSAAWGRLCWAFPRSHSQLGRSEVSLIFVERSWADKQVLDVAARAVSPAPHWGRAGRWTRGRWRTGKGRRVRWHEADLPPASPSRQLPREPGSSGLGGSFGHFHTDLLKTYCVPGPAPDLGTLPLSSGEGELFPKDTRDQNFLTGKTLF